MRARLTGAKQSQTSGSGTCSRVRSPTRATAAFLLRLSNVARHSPSRPLNSSNGAPSGRRMTVRRRCTCASAKGASLPAARSASTKSRDTLMELVLEVCCASLHDAVMTAGRTEGFTDINRQHWSLRYLPPWMRPYSRLARWDRPIGIWLLLMPCWWSLALGAAPDWGRLAGWMALFALGATAMRGAGCTWNDIVDRKVDAQVERTRGRPLPSGEVTLRNALIWMVLQSLVGVLMLLKFKKFGGGVALASLVLVAIYPTMKRLTSWPQVVLGLAFNWGALVGYAAVTGTLSWATIALYAGGLAWTLVYDTIYAMQDQRDDAVIGVRSTARRFAEAPRRWLALFAGLALAAWALAGQLAGLDLGYFVLLLGVALHFAWQIACLRPHDPADCLSKFKANGWLGLLLVAAIIAGHPS